MNVIGVLVPIKKSHKIDSRLTKIRSATCLVFITNIVRNLGKKDEKIYQRNNKSNNERQAVQQDGQRFPKFSVVVSLAVRRVFLHVVLYQKFCVLKIVFCSESE